MISYGDMLDVVETEEAKNALQTPPTTPPVETPKETLKKENNEDNIEYVIDEEEGENEN